MGHVADQPAPVLVGGAEIGCHLIECRCQLADFITRRGTHPNAVVALGHRAGRRGHLPQGRRHAVGHELRTPITALQAVLENVVDGVVEPDVQTMRLALSQTERLGELVTDLLDLSRLEGGAIPLQINRFDVEAFLRAAVEHVSVSADDVAVAVEVSPPGLTALADPARLRQVVVNLVDNAIRHSPPGGSVTVRATRDAAGLRLEVADQGPGIAPAERERVFERFTRGATSDGGTGLGLAIARWAVELHGGVIDVVETKVGCRFTVSIPESEERSA